MPRWRSKRFELSISICWQECPPIGRQEFRRLSVTRFVLHENWRTTTLDRLGIKRYYIWAWLVCPALGLITIWLSVLLGLAAFDPNLILAQVAGYEFPPGADFRVSFLMRLLPVAVAMPAVMTPINMGKNSVAWIPITATHEDRSRSVGSLGRYRFLLGHVAYTAIPEPNVTHILDFS